MSTTVYGFDYLIKDSIYTPEIDKKRFNIAENEIYGIYEYVGPGILEGWDVISWSDCTEKDNDEFISKGLSYITQSEINSLSNLTKQSLLNLNYKMVIKITEGDGIVDHYAAFTTSDVYYGFPNFTESIKYYVYIVPTPALADPQKHYAQVYISTVSDYDTNYIATYIATVNIYYNTSTKENYILSIENEDSRRRELYRFKGVNSDELKNTFLKHKHDGRDISKIKINTSDISDIQEVPPVGSPIYNINKIDLQQSLSNGPEINSATFEESGGTLEAGNWYYQVTFNIKSSTNSELIESLPGDIKQVTITSNRKIKLKWDKVIGAYSYNLYRTENANDSSSRIYLLKKDISNYQFTDDGSIEISTVSPPTDDYSEKVIGKSSLTSSNPTYISPNDATYYENSEGNYVPINYNIPGIFQVDNSIGANKIVQDANSNNTQNFYKVEVRLNGHILAYDDYKIITQESGVNDSGDGLDNGLIELKNNISTDDVLEVIKYIDPTQTQVYDVLRSNRIDFIDASTIKYGTISKRYLDLPNHYGTTRIKENTYLLPYSDMRTKDYINYFILNPNSNIQYDEEILYIGNCINASKNIGVPSFFSETSLNDTDSYINSERTVQTSSNVSYQQDSILLNSETVVDNISGLGKYIVGTRSGNYITSDFKYFEKLINLDTDNGIVIDCIDNLVFGIDYAGQEGIENKFYETFVLLNTGKVFYSRDNCISWTEISYPLSSFFTTSFRVSTTKDQVESGDESKGYKYGRRFYIGGYTTSTPVRSGVWTDTLTDSQEISDVSWSMMPIWKTKQNQQNMIYSICEIITYSFNQTDLSFIESWDSTIYIGSNSGLYKDNTFISNIIYPTIVPLDIIWITDLEDRRNNIIIKTIDAIYTTKDAEYIEKNTPSGSSARWSLPFEKNIGRFYKISDVVDFENVSQIYSVNYNDKYYMFGGDNSVWYGTENAHPNGGLNGALLFEVPLSSQHGAAALHFNSSVDGIHSSGTLYFDVDVYSSYYVNQILNLSDSDYSLYWGWNLPYWSKSKNSDYIENPSSLMKIGYIRQYTKDGPAPTDGILGRTGPLSGQSLTEEENQNYIGFTYLLKSNNIKIDIYFENGTNILDSNNNSLLPTINTTGSGLLDKETNIMWIESESYCLIQNIDEKGNKVDISFENIYAPTSQIPTSQISSTVSVSSDITNIIGNSTGAVIGVASGGLFGSGVINSSGLAYISSSMIVSSKNGLWLSENKEGKIFNRVYNYFTDSIIPSIYINDIICSESNYSIDYINQSITFNIQRNIYDKIIMEKDFKEYFAINGSWIESSDIIVYINDIPLNLSYSILSDKGMVRLDNSIDRNSIVKISIIGTESYLDLTSTNKIPLTNYLPHSEVDTAYNVNKDIFTYLSEDLKINSNYIKVYSTTDFPSNTKYLMIDDEIISVSKYNSSSFICSSSNVTQEHFKGTIVYLLKIESILGIQDRLSMETSNGTEYYLHSTYVSNLIGLTNSLRHIYPEIDGQSSLLLPNYINEEGFTNSLFHIFDYDTIDELNSFTNYREGMDYNSNYPPKDSLQVFCSYKNIDFNTDGSLIGTDTGIWKNYSGEWILVSTCDDCSRVYFIKKARGNIWSGTDNGIFISEDDGDTWTKNATYYQDVFDIETGNIRWTSNRKQYDKNQYDTASTDATAQEARDASTVSDKPFEAFLKQDGLIFILYSEDTDGSGDFDSDHSISVDSYDVYSMMQYEGRKQEPATDTKKARISKEDIFIIGGENGLYILSNSRTLVNDVYHPYSNFISESNMINTSDIYFNSDKLDSNSEIIVENLKIYDMFFSPKLPYYSSSYINSDDQFINSLKYGKNGNIYTIFLTNDGIKISENQVWMKTNSGEYLSWISEPLKGENYICNCHLTIRDTDSTYIDETFRKFVRIFVGTNKGVIYSIDGGFTWIPCGRFPNIDNLTVYGLEYSNNILYSFTNRGIYTSIDYGNIWSKADESLIKLSNYEFFNSNEKLSQTFIPYISNIKKISIWMKSKYDVNTFDDSYDYMNEAISNINLKIYDTDIDGKPGNTLIYTSTTQVFADEIKEPRWVNFECDTILNPNLAYAIVIEESGYTEKFTGIAVSRESDYINGSIYKYNGTWSRYNNDFIFLIHYDMENQITTEEFEVTYSQVNANNLAVTIYNNLILDMRFVFSFIIDSTGSMSYQDPNEDIKDLILEFINKILGRNRLGYIDIWSFDTKLKQITNGLTINYDDIDGVVKAISFSGDDSEVWAGSSVGLGNASYSGIKDAIIRDNSYEYVINYMNDMYIIDYDYLYSIDNSYDKTLNTLLSDKYTHLRDIIIDDYIFTFGRIGFVFTDGFDNSSIDENWRSPAWAMNGIKNDQDCPLYFFGIGRDNAQTSMIASSEETGGKFYQISDNISYLRNAFDELLNGDQYIWNGIYKDNIDLGEEAQYVGWIQCPVTVPSGYIASDLVIFEIRYTSDFKLWSNWISVPLNQQYNLNIFTNYIEYKITIKQGDKIIGDPYHEYDDNEYVDYGYYETSTDDYPGPIVGAIRYSITYPTENIYILNSIQSGNMFEYLMNYNSINSTTSKLEYKIGRGDSLRYDLFKSSKLKVKSTLPIRERSIRYVAELPVTYNLTDMDPNNADESRKVFVAISSDNIIKWTDEDSIEIYLGTQYLDPNIYQYMEIPTQATVVFTNQVQGTEKLTIKITKAGYIDTKKGEDTIRLNNNTFLATNGPWAPDARVIIYRNDLPVLGGFFLIPYEGKIIFDGNVLDQETVRIFIQNSEISRVAIISKNYSNLPIVMEDFGMMWSTIDGFSDTEILDSIIDPIVENVELKIDNYIPISSDYISEGSDSSKYGNMHSLPYVKYDYIHQNGMPEQGTEIRWYRKRKNETQFTEITSYYNKKSKDISDEMEYWNINNSSVWQPTSLWTEGDTWRVSVVPKTINSTGTLVYSNDFVISVYNNNEATLSYKSSRPPVIYDLKIYKNDVSTNPLTISVGASHLEVISTTAYEYYEIPNDYTGDLRVKLQYADGDNTDLRILLDNFVIKWYQRGKSEPVYDSSAGTFVKNSNNEIDKWLVPAITDGTSWYAQIIPYDGISYGQTVVSLRIERASSTGV